MSDLTVKDLVNEAHRIAKLKGWHDEGERNFGEVVALIHSELSEALEAARDGVVFVPLPLDAEDIAQGDTKPEGILIELADAVIRIADYCGSRGWDLDFALRAKMAYNATREYKHGKKF